MGRATQGVRVMNMKEDDRISAVALVVESSASVAEEAVAAEEAGDGVVKDARVASADGSTE
jgi:hypothetical protein